MSEFLKYLDSLEKTPKPKSGYQGGKQTRQMRLWRPMNRSADTERKSDIELLTARAKWLGRNNPLCIGARDTLVNNVIGEGIRTKAKARDGLDGMGELLTEWNRQSDYLYQRWMEHADLQGRMHWYEMERTNFAQTIESGNGFIVETASDDPNRLLPIAFELVEVDQLDTTRDRPGTPTVNEIRNGIEFDSQRRRVAYWFYPTHPLDAWTYSAESVRIPASRVIHLFRAKRPSQTIGVSWFAPIVQQVWDFYEYQTHEIDAAKVAAFFVYMHKQAEPTGDLGIPDEDGETSPTDDDSGAPEAPLGPGIGMTGGPDDSLEVIQSNRATQATPWLQTMLQTMGTGIGLSYMRFTGDVSQTNFSSARVADLQDRKGFVPLQAWHAWYVDTEIRRRVTRQAIAMGLLPIPAGGTVRFNRNPDRWLCCKAVPPGWGYVDPDKQIKASIASIGAGLSTFERELGAVGLDPDEVFPVLAAELKELKRLGIPLDNVFPAPKPAPGDTSDGDQEADEAQQQQEQQA